MDEDFGYDGVKTTDGGTPNNSNEPIEDITTGEVDKDVDEIDSSNDNNETNETEEESSSDFAPGTVLEVGDDEYTVDKDGNLLDKDGNLFKNKDEIAEWYKQFDEVTESDDLSIDNIIKAVDIQITDENDKPIEFENTPSGVKSYIDAVLESGREEQQNEAIQTLLAKYPFVSDVIAYYTVNGNSLEGWGAKPDRSSITIDANNENQQIEIIKAAWKERGNKGDVNGYIDYLKNSGTLLTTAESELQALKDADKAAKDKLEKEAIEKEKENQKLIVDYWNGVKEVIDNKEIAGYRIPDNIIIERDGKKLTATPQDFFNYIYRQDSKGHSQYEYDLMKVKPEDRLQDDILRAYLTFTGGKYSNLVDIAINDKNVKTLRLKAKQGTKGTTVRVTKPRKPESLDFGY